MRKSIFKNAVENTAHDISYGLEVYYETEKLGKMLACCRCHNLDHPFKEIYIYLLAMMLINSYIDDGMFYGKIRIPSFGIIRPGVVTFHSDSE